MASSMEAPGEDPSAVLQGEHLRGHEGHQSQPIATQPLASAPADHGQAQATTSSGLQGGEAHSAELRPSALPALRQRVRQVRQMHHLSDRLQVGPKPRGMVSSLPTALFGIISLAASLVDNIVPASPAPSNKTTTTAKTRARPSAKSSSTPWQLLDHETDKAQGDPGGWGKLQPGLGGRDLPVGRRRKLTGSWNNSAKLLESEVKTYQSMMTYSQAPHYDILELYAGSAKFSAFAPDYGLTAIQPIDYYGNWDLKRPDHRQQIKDQFKRWKPWILIIGFPCTHFSLFSENLNWRRSAERWAQLQELREADLPELHFVADLIEEQINNGRLFLLENPIRSRLWEDYRLQRI